MNSGDGPIMETSHSQRATITNPSAQDLPGVTEIIAVFPNHCCHVAEMLGLGLAQAEGHRRFQFSFPIFLDSVRGHCGCCGKGAFHRVPLLVNHLGGAVDRVLTDFTPAPAGCVTCSFATASTGSPFSADSLRSSPSPAPRGQM